MLVLVRKEGEEVCIGDDIRIVIDRISPTKVALAIEAPRHLPVHRKEVFDAIKRFDGRPDSSGG